MSVLRDAPTDPDIQTQAAAPASVQQRIYEWSTELPPWQRDLLRRLTTGVLSGDDEEAILKMVLDEADAPTPRPLERADLPQDDAETGPVELREISNVQNINLLAEEQTLRFEPGLNAVFGGTGAGKSGYGRLLRRLCRPAESVEVMRNAFDANADGKPQTATVKIALGDDPREIDVDLAIEPDRVLSTMSCFDAASTTAHMSKPSVIEHVPGSLLLLRRLAEAQETLQARLKKEIAALQGTLSKPKVPPGTPAARLVDTITAETDVAELERRAKLNEAERAEMKRLDIALAAFRSDDSRKQERAARARAKAIDKVADQIERALNTLTDERIAAIAELRARLDETVAAERALANDAFSELPHSGTGQGPWCEMWEAARRFVESGGGTFPTGDPGSACPLCQHELAGETRERLLKLEQFVRSDFRKKAARLADDLSQAVNGLPDVTTLAELVDASLSGAPEQVMRSANAAVEALTARAQLAQRRAKGAPVSAEPVPKVPPVMPIRAHADERLSAAETQAALRDEAGQQRLIERRTALRGRAELAAMLPAISEHIGALKKVGRYKKASVELRTQKVSAQLRKLQEDAVTNRLRTAIVEELEALDLLAAEIDIAGKAKGGRAAIEFGLRGTIDVKVGAVLSEGEQRALALAFFLAESAVGRGRSAIVLDDPAALLDRDRCAHVAKRLAQEAQQRQVIVFTHDLAFLQMLKRAAADAGHELHSQAIRRAYGRAGIIGDVPLSSGTFATS